jgi:hypothetical protein
MNRPAPRRDTEAPRLDLVGAGLLAFGVYQIAIGLFMAVAPGTFFEELAAFGVRNDHYIRDLATFELPLGVVFLVAVFRPGWRVPALAFGVLHFALHSVSHLVDIGEADPEWLGPSVFVALAVATAILGWLLWRAIEDGRERARGAS